MGYGERFGGKQIYDEDNDYYYPESYSKNYNAPSGVHIMNKNEKKALRKLKSKTGLNEKELREEKANRKLLSEAQKVKGNKTDTDRLILSFVKGILRELKLPVDHPDVQQALNKELNKSHGYYNQRLRLWFAPMSAKSITYRYNEIRKKQNGKGKS